MPRKSHRPQQFFLAAKTLFQNAQEEPALRSVLEGYGYTQARLAEGERLLSETEDLFRLQAEALGREAQAVQGSRRAREQAEGAYRKTRRLARLEFGAEPLAGQALGLAGPRVQTHAGWLVRASTFYANLLSDPGLGRRLGRFGVSDRILTAEASLVDGYREALQVRAQEAGRARQATADRNAKLAELDRWVGELRAVARLAWADQPSVLVRLGIR